MCIHIWYLVELKECTFSFGFSIPSTYVALGIFFSYFCFLSMAKDNIECKIGCLIEYRNLDPLTNYFKIRIHCVTTYVVRHKIFHIFISDTPWMLKNAQFIQKIRIDFVNMEANMDGNGISTFKDLFTLLSLHQNKWFEPLLILLCSFLWLSKITLMYCYC